jgi:hypothetical protein
VSKLLAVYRGYRGAYCLRLAGFGRSLLVSFYPSGVLGLLGYGPRGEWDRLYKLWGV